MCIEDSLTTISLFPQCWEVHIVSDSVLCGWKREKRKQTQEAVIYWIPSIMKSGGYWSLHKDQRREMVGRNKLYLLKCKYGKDWEELGMLLWPMNWHQSENQLETCLKGSNGMQGLVPWPMRKNKKWRKILIRFLSWAHFSYSSIPCFKRHFMNDFLNLAELLNSPKKCNKTLLS